MVPLYPDFRELRLSDASVIRSFFQSDQSGIAEYSFANLYLFREAHRYRFSIWEQFLFLTGRSYGGEDYAFPPFGQGDMEQALIRLGASFGAGQNEVFFPVSEDRATSQFGSSQWRCISDRNQADYVYSRQDLATLPGKKYHKRKNRLSKFLRELDRPYQYQTMNDAHLADCLALAEGWCDIRCSVQRPSTYLETEAAKEALRLREALGLRGGVILLDGQVRAFCLGEPLNSDTFVVHFEKTEPGREGLAQVINRDFCLHELAEYTFVNREQDLGDAGLRHAKESYYPVRLVEKYRVERA